MIFFNYSIIQDEGDEKVEYKRENFPENLPNAVYLEGRNSRGKSTLLNILALAFYGLKKEKDELSETLRGQLLDLDSDDQEITFHIEISNEVIGQTLIAKKQDHKKTEIKRRILIDGKEKPLTDTYFKDNFNLLYDIPDNPRERLKELLNEIMVDQAYYSSKVGELRNFVRRVQDDIDEQRTPEKEQRLNSELKKQIKSIDSIKNKGEKASAHLLDTKTYCYSRMYISYCDRLTRIKKQLLDAEKKSKLTTNKEKKQSTQQAKLLEEIRKESQNAQDLYPIVTELLEVLTPSSENHHLGIWYGCNIIQEIKQSDQIETIRQEIEFFNSMLKSLKEKEDSDKIYHVEVLEQFLEFFQHYESFKMKLPGVNKTIQEIAKNIENEIDKYENIIIKRDNISKCSKKLEELLESLKGAISSKNKYKQLLQEHGETIEVIKQGVSETELKALEENKLFNERWMNYYEKELNKLDIEKDKAEQKLKKIEKKPHIKILDQLTENQLKEKIVDLTGIKSKYKTDCNSAERSLNYITEEIKRFNKSEEHPYLKYSIKLEKVLKTILTLEQKLGTDFDIRIKDLKMKKVRNTKEDKDYLEIISTFLAQKVPYIRHGTIEHKVAKIDMINDVVITDKDKKIKFRKMGTGQSQSAYLVGKLHTNDDRKIIALFDEVAAMDSSSLQPIKDGFKKMYKNGKLFSGIIVQKHDDREKFEDLT